MRLRTLGGAALVGTSFHRTKSLLLLAYLAVEGPRDRAHLRQLFWPEAVDGAASLRVVLTQIRAVAPELLCISGNAVTFVGSSDVGMLMAALRDQPKTLPDLYTGAFLESINLDHLGAELEEWILATREYLAQQVREQLILHAEEQGTLGAEAAELAADALRVAGAPPPEPTELTRIYALLARHRHPLASEVRRQLDDFGWDAPLPVPIPFPDMPHTFSRTHSPFIGRSTEREQVQRALCEEQRPVVTLQGPGGIGKTRLALEVMRTIAETSAFPGGQQFLSLETVQTEEALLQALGRAVGLPSLPDPTVSSVAVAIGHERTLMVLDNFEQLTPSALLLAELTNRCPGLRLLVTSRQRLHLSCEAIQTLGGLKLPLGNAQDPGQALQADATHLFLQAARRARLDFRLSTAELPDVIHLLRQLGGVPLAIELAAAWLQALSPAQILEELNKSQELLESSNRDIPDRHRSLRSVFDASWRRLDSREQRALRRLSVFVGGFTHDAAAEVAGATLPTLLTLIDHSLLRTDSPGRFEFHPLLREFTRAQLAAGADEDAELQTRHAAYFHTLAHVAALELHGPLERTWIQRLRRDQTNLRAALNYFAERHDWTALASLNFDLYDFWYSQGLFTEGLGWMQMIPEQLQNQDARIMHFRSGLTAAIGDLDVSRRALDRGLILIARVPQPLSVDDAAIDAHLHLHLAHIELRSGNFGACEQAALYAQRRYQALKDLLLEAVTLGLLSGAYLNCGRFADAQAAMERALCLSSPGNRSWGQIVARHNLGELLYANGDTVAAEFHFHEVIDLAREFGDPNWDASALTRLGELALLNGALVSAKAQIHAALNLLLKVDDRCNLLRTINTVGQFTFLHGWSQEGVTLWGAADTGHKQLGLHLEPLPQRNLDQWLTNARAAMGKEAFQHAWVSGTRQTWAGVLALTHQQLGAALKD